MDLDEIRKYVLEWFRVNRSAIPFIHCYGTGRRRRSRIRTVYRESVEQGDRHAIIFAYLEITEHRGARYDFE